MVSGSSCPCNGAVVALGRSTCTPEVSMGAVTMKMMSSTSMTSTIGVTLISEKACLRRERLLPPFPPGSPNDTAMLSLDLPRHQQAELNAEIFKLAGKLIE